LILIDTNIFYNFLFDTELTDRSEKVFELEEMFFTTFTVWNETTYIISRKIAEIKLGIKSYNRFRELVKKKGYISVLRNWRNLWNLSTNWVSRSSKIIKIVQSYGKSWRSSDFCQTMP